MKVKYVMTPNPYVLNGEQTLEEATKLFIDKRIDGAPVTDIQGELNGFITKSDILKYLLKIGNVNAQVKSIMTTEVVSVDINTNINSIVDLTPSKIPVLDKNKIVGMITKSDLANSFYKRYKDLNEELETVIDSVYNAIITINKEAKVQIYNSAAQRIFGIPARDVIDKHISEFLPQNKLVEILHSGKTELNQKIDYNGKTLISNRTPLIVDDTIIGAVAVVQDISELEEISNELKYTRDLKEELDAIIESSFDGIFVTDGNGKILRFNDAYTRISGINKDELIGKNMDELVEEGVFDQSATLEVIQKQKPVTVVQEIKTGKTVLATGNPVFNKNKQLTRIVTNVRDITELNKLKQELDQAYKLSEHYQHELSKFKIEDSQNYVIKSPKSKAILDLIMRLGQVESTVLIQGESGVGKEIFASILHKNSLRKDKPFIKINCGAIPEMLLESELFGYEAGAFTGAKKEGKMGLYEIANTGTLFLDEIGELPLILQVKLLRVIQEREITRVGGIKPIKVDVRLIAATNRDLWEMVVKNQFRKDLFYRLNVVPVIVPPLRERKEEIPALITHFVHMFNNKYSLNKRLESKVIEKLLSYEWPGNIRELENFIERVLVTSNTDVIKDVPIPNELNDDYQYNIDYEINSSLKDAVENLEKQMIAKALEDYGTTRKAAKVLGVSQPTIVRKAARYGIKISNPDD